MTRIINCDRCKHHRASFDFVKSEVIAICTKDKRDYSDIPDENYTHEIEKQIVRWHIRPST